MKVHPLTIRNWIKQGKLKASKQFHIYEIDPTELFKVNKTE